MLSKNKLIDPIQIIVVFECAMLQSIKPKGMDLFTVCNYDASLVGGRVEDANAASFTANIWRLFRVYLGVRTYEVFLCFLAIMFVRSIVLASLFSLFYVTRQRNRFLHRG